jgi:hypothetical protein
MTVLSLLRVRGCFVSNGVRPARRRTTAPAWIAGVTD